MGKLAILRGVDSYEFIENWMAGWSNHRSAVMNSVYTASNSPGDFALFERDVHSALDYIKLLENKAATTSNLEDRAQLEQRATMETEWIAGYIAEAIPEAV